MTTKKRSKPRAIYIVFDKDGFDLVYRGSLKEARSEQNDYESKCPYLAPYTIVKYVREVMRK